jgi:ribosomal protein L27
LPTARRIGFEKRTVWEILLGQRGSKNHFGTGVSQGCRIISVFMKKGGIVSVNLDGWQLNFTIAPSSLDYAVEKGR